jgi:hypothetical protein
VREIIKWAFSNEKKKKLQQIVWLQIVVQ